MAIRRATEHIGLSQKAAANPIVPPGALDAEMAGQPMDRPHRVNLVGTAMLLIPADPLIVFADLQDGRSGDLRAARRAKPFPAARVSNLRVPIAVTPQLLEARHHRVVPRALTLAQDRWADNALRAMPTAPDNPHVNAIGSRPGDNDPCHQAPPQSLALLMTELGALPQVGEVRAQVEELMSLLKGQSRLARCAGKTLGRFLGVA